MKKKYRLEKQLCEDTESYDRDTVEKYIEYLEEQKRLIKIGNLLFDVEAMLTPFTCHTSLCVPDGKGKICGKKAEGDCCCGVYAPRVSIRERERIEKILPAIYERFPGVKKAIDKAKGYYEWDENYDRIMSKNKKDLCVFMTPDEKDFGFYACTIHAYCLENHLSPWIYKPSACTMFPLFILDPTDEEERMLITIHGKEVMTLGETEENYREIHCLDRNPSAKQPIYIEMKSTLVHMFGAEAWKKLDEALKKRPK